MRTDPPAWAVPRLSTDHVDALAAYRQGIAALVAGAGHARGLLTAAVEHDPLFCLGHVALGVADALEGQSFRPVDPPAVLSRGERQHLEIVNAAFAGDAGRAVDLRREHLIDYPGDLLIVWLPVLTGR